MYSCVLIWFMYLYIYIYEYIGICPHKWDCWIHVSNQPTCSFIYLLIYSLSLSHQPTNSSTTSAYSHVHTHVCYQSLIILPLTTYSYLCIHTYVGYCLLPVIGLAGLSVLINLKGILGMYLYDICDVCMAMCDKNFCYMYV